MGSCLVTLTKVTQANQLNYLIMCKATLSHHLAVHKKLLLILSGQMV